MIHIAVVDDQTEAISGILSVFQQWENENHVNFEIDTYIDADLFCDAIFDKKYQALFLDLDMPKKSGLTFLSPCVNLEIIRRLSTSQIEMT